MNLLESLLDAFHNLGNSFSHFTSPQHVEQFIDHLGAISTNLGQNIDPNQVYDYLNQNLQSWQQQQPSQDFYQQDNTHNPNSFDPTHLTLEQQQVLNSALDYIKGHYIIPQTDFNSHLGLDASLNTHLNMAMPREGIDHMSLNSFRDDLSNVRYHISEAIEHQQNVSFNAAHPDLALSDHRQFTNNESQKMEVDKTLTALDNAKSDLANLHWESPQSTKMLNDLNRVDGLVKDHKLSEAQSNINSLISSWEKARSKI